MKPLQAFFATALALGLGGQAFAQKDFDKLHEKINGTWKASVKNGASTVDTKLVFDDGALTISIAGKVIRGSYKFLDNKRIEITLRTGTQQRSRKTNFNLKQNNLTLSDEEGKSETFTRTLE